MSAFEDYLISQGFQRMKRTSEGFIPVGDNFTFSTMTSLSVCYVKDGLVIVYGLNERGLPPTLIEPRPKFIKEGNVFRSYRDHDAHRWLANTPFDEILQEIKNIDASNKKSY